MRRRHGFAPNSIFHENFHFLIFCRNRSSGRKHIIRSALDSWEFIFLEINSLIAPRCILLEEIVLLLSFADAKSDICLSAEIYEAQDLLFSDFRPTALTVRLSGGGVYPVSMNRFHSSDCKNIWDEPSWARQYCVFSRVCPYNQYPVLASLLKKSFRKFWGLDFPLEILQGSKISPVGFLKENQDLKIFENFFNRLANTGYWL